MALVSITNYRALLLYINADRMSSIFAMPLTYRKLWETLPLLTELLISHIHYNMNLISFSNLNTAEKLTCNHLLLLQRCIFKFFRPAFKSAERRSELFERLLPLLLFNFKLRKLFFAFVNMQL